MAKKPKRSARRSLARLRSAKADEMEFWLSRTPLERLAEFERLRQLKYGYDPLTALVERVIQIIDLEDQ